MITLKQALEKLREHAAQHDDHKCWMRPTDAAKVLELMEALLLPKDEPELGIMLHSIRAEFAFACLKFPGSNLNLAALGEEYGELVKACMDEPQARVYKEAVQTAAMCIRVALQGDPSLAEWRAGKGLDALA